MPHKAMTDFQRVKAGMWIEKTRNWMETRPSLTLIAEQASKELGFRVTVWFVRNYLGEADWWKQIQEGPKPTPRGEQDQLREAVAITIEAVEKMLEPVHPTEAVEIRRSVQRAKTMVGTISTSPPAQAPDLLGGLLRSGEC